MKISQHSQGMDNVVMNCQPKKNIRQGERQERRCRKEPENRNYGGNLKLYPVGDAEPLKRFNQESCIIGHKELISLGEAYNKGPKIIQITIMKYQRQDFLWGLDIFYVVTL